jgi:hypothetical protein
MSNTGKLNELLDGFEKSEEMLRLAQSEHRDAQSRLFEYCVQEKLYKFLTLNTSALRAHARVSIRI